MADGDVAVVGGGINGICIAWEFASRNRQVDVIEAKSLMSQTSSASSKLLHGGLRYLEYGQIGLVREALRERAWWLAHAPNLTSRLKLLLPLYEQSPRSRCKIAVGLTIYDMLAGKHGLGRHSWLPRAEIEESFSGLIKDGLRGAYVFYDGQMNDAKLGLWAAQQARRAGASFVENTPVKVVSTDGTIELESGELRRYSLIVNATGPWASKLLEQSTVHSEYAIKAIRGSHLLIRRSLNEGYCLQHPDDGRVFFVLPYENNVLIGTTEVEQDIDESIVPSEEEVGYLKRGFNSYFRNEIGREDVIDSFAGVRPIVQSGGRPTSGSRGYVIEYLDCLINVWGGKWTTSRALARKVYRNSRRCLH